MGITLEEAESLAEQYQTQYNELYEKYNEEVSKRQELEQKVIELESKLEDSDNDSKDDNDYIEHLESELNKANETLKALEEHSDEAVKNGKDKANK